MCDLGMSRTSGTIVAVRDDSSVGDAEWLDAYRLVLPKREVSQPTVPVETVVLETMVAARANRADGPAALETTESGASGSSIELAEAV